jgi:prepilin signal peptidase PulO-like enzyme (type II secretory pathway)
MVEGLTGLLTAALWLKVATPSFASTEVFAQTPAINYLLPFGLYFIFICLLVVITFVDLEHLIIPHSFTLPGMVVGLATPLLINWFLEPGALAHFWPKVTVFESVVGLIAGGAVVVIIFYSYFAVRGVAGIGGGDVTLMALVGAWLGWPALVFVFFAASVQGTLAAVGAMVFGGGLLRDSAEIFAEDEVDGDETLSEDSEADTVAVIDTAVDDGRVEDDEKVEDNEKVEDAPDEEELAQGGMAVPFGPFIALAAAEHFFIGELLPPMVSMSYLYSFGP